MSIMAKPLKVLGQKASIYELDQLDDESLALIVRPELKVKVTYKQETQVNGSPVKEVKMVTAELEGTIFD
jgi:WD40 repeat protein